MTADVNQGLAHNMSVQTYSSMNTKISCSDDEEEKDYLEDTATTSMSNDISTSFSSHSSSGILYSSSSSSSSSNSSSSSMRSSFTSADARDSKATSIHGVKFSSIDIRSYKITLGDNPSCSYGPPISLDWEYSNNIKMSIDEYEKSRGARRKSYQMQMNSQYREKLLQTWDITPDEIQYRVKELKLVRKGRDRTKMMLPFRKIEDIAESMKRKAKRAMS